MNCFASSGAKRSIEVLSTVAIKVYAKYEKVALDTAALTVVQSEPLQR